MKIAIPTTSMMTAHSGGIGTYARELVRTLHSEGHTCVTPVVQHYNERNGRHYKDTYSDAKLVVDQFTSPHWNTGIDYIACMDLYDALPAIELHRRTRAPIVTFKHFLEEPYERARKSGLEAWGAQYTKRDVAAHLDRLDLERRLLLRSELVIANSSWTADGIRSLTGERDTPNNLQVLEPSELSWPFVDRSQVQSVPLDRLWSSSVNIDPLKIFVPGRVVPIKGQDLIVRAARLLGRKVPVDIVFAGSSKMPEKLQKMLDTELYNATNVAHRR